MGLIVSTTASCTGNLFGRRRSPPPPPPPSPSTTTDSSPPPKNKVSDQEVERVFRHLDADGDGRISAAEIRKIRRCTDEEAEEMVATADSDGDGFISIDELQKVMEGGDESDLRAAFDEFDENKDGVITAEEVRRVLRRLGLAEAELTAEQMVAAADGNGDGVVSFDEFKALMAAKLPPA
ncbi:hypothetical protein EJB05_19915, partial [Eragrostis curvula]